ncbi:hypothetical protein SRABI106_01418 [Rahnella aquatilis]|nr:hypothetical protein SRABI106_01418 [Rahnella aquatilis]
MQEIPLSPSKSQEVVASLNNQTCKIKLHQRSTGFYMDLYIGDKAIAQGVICLNCNYMVRYPYLGFSGDLVFVDTKGTDDPAYDEIGTRFKLYYLTKEEMK